MSLWCITVLVDFETKASYGSLIVVRAVDVATTGLDIHASHFTDAVTDVRVSLIRLRASLRIFLANLLVRFTSFWICLRISFINLQVFYGSKRVVINCAAYKKRT
jgi:hypothetical protein